MLEMPDVDVAPVLLQIFGDQAAMAMMGFIFTAKETPVAEELFGYCVLNLSVLHQLEEKLRVSGPPYAALLVFVEHFLSW